MSIYNLVYVSKAVGLDLAAGGPHQIEEILNVARSKNALAGVTGALLFTEGRFVQVLEGIRREVQATFERIQSDPRHAEIDILSSQHADHPRFKDWSMVFVGESPRLRVHFADVPLAGLGHRRTGDALLDFMLDVARSSSADY